jgi:hypothetical protein
MAHDFDIIEGRDTMASAGLQTIKRFFQGGARYPI